MGITTKCRKEVNTVDSIPEVCRLPGKESILFFAVGYSVVLNEQSYIPDSGRFNDYVETLPQFHSRYQIEFGAV